MRRHRSSRAVRVAAAALAIGPFALLSGEAFAQDAPTWWQFQGGPGHPGVLADGPEPPYRVRWTLPAPAGDALSGAVVAGDLAVSIGTEAVYGIDMVSGAIEWQVARGGDPCRCRRSGPAHGGGSSCTWKARVRAMEAERRRDRRARAKAQPRVHRLRPRRGPARLPPDRRRSPTSRRSSRSHSPTEPSSGERRWRRSRGAVSRSRERTRS